MTAGLPHILAALLDGESFFHDPHVGRAVDDLAWHWIACFVLFLWVASRVSRLFKKRF